MLVPVCQDVLTIMMSGIGFIYEVLIISGIAGVKLLLLAHLQNDNKNACFCMPGRTYVNEFWEAYQQPRRCNLPETEIKTALLTGL